MSDFTHIGSTQLLQDLLERQLIGSMCSTVDSDERGCVFVTFSSTPRAFEFTRSGGGSVLSLAKRIALPFASLLQIHAREAALLREHPSATGQAEPAPVAMVLRGGVGETPLVCEWQDTPAILYRDLTDQVELRFAEAAAGQLGAAIIEQLAQAHISGRAELLARSVRGSKRS